MDKKQVLVVDDEPVILEAVMNMLECEDIGTAGASDLAGARCSLQAQFYPVVVADIRLHSEAEGLMLLDEIRTNAPDSRVICMTGNISEEIEAEVRRRGAVFVFDKSCGSPEPLIDAVMELLAEVEKLAGEKETLDLEQLYTSTRRLMQSIPMRRYGLSAEQAEDVVHEAWMLFLERQGIVRAARSWLAGTVAKLSLSQRRRNARELTDEEFLEGLIDERGADWANVMAVRAALENVDPRSRLLATMIGMEGHSYVEVSEKTGYALGAIGPLYIRAKSRLRKALTH